MKQMEIILIVVAVLLGVVAVELAVAISSYNTNAKLEIASNREVLDSNTKLENIMSEVAADLSAVVDKFCGGRKSR